MIDDLTQRIASATAAYERERGFWDWLQPPPPHCDASYFRLRRFVALDAPRCIIERETDLLRRKITHMQQVRLGVSVH